MKACKKNFLKLNNAGMSLIELLVAIAIMAVALVPLLFSFVNVAKYNARAREMQQTTALAHTVMENCKAYSMEDIKTQMTGGTFLTGVPASQIYYDVANSTYYLTGVTAENGTYDVSLKFTPHSFVSGASATGDILNTESINPYLDAVFTPMGTQFNVDFPDGSSANYTAAELDQLAYLNALQVISENMKAVTEADLGTGKGVTLSESFIENSFKDNSPSNPNYNKFTTSRIIRILMWNPSDHEAVNVYYEYEFKTTDGKFYYKHTKEDGTEVTYECDANSTPTYSTIIYSNSLTNDVTHPTKIENLYFFYYPGYGGALSVFPLASDEMVVSNQLADGTRQIDVYLIKQKNPAYNDSNLSIVEASYATKVTGLYNGSYTSGTNIYHNFDVNLGGGTTPYNASSWFTSNLNIMPKLVPTESKVLMYDVELNIYNTGAYNMTEHLLDTTKQPVMTMNGTTLDW